MADRKLKRLSRTIHRTCVAYNSTVTSCELGSINGPHLAKALNDLKVRRFIATTQEFGECSIIFRNWFLKTSKWTTGLTRFIPRYLRHRLKSIHNPVPIGQMDHLPFYVRDARKRRIYFHRLQNALKETRKVLQNDPDISQFGVLALQQVVSSRDYRKVVLLSQDLRSRPYRIRRLQISKLIRHLRLRTA